MLNFGAVHLQADPAQQRLKLSTRRQEAGWKTTSVSSLKQQDGTRGETLGWASQKKDSDTDVRFFQGKGGFCAIVTTSDLTYIALPGSKIKLPDTTVELPGAPITGSGKSSSGPSIQTPPQQVTRQAMILGAGMASRFEPVSGDVTGFPKPGVPLNGEDSVILSLARHMARHGIRKIIVNTYYMPERVKEQLVGKVPGVEFVFIDEAQPSGTAGGLAKALKSGMVDKTQPILIMQGDAVTDGDLTHLLNAHQRSNAKVTLGVQEVPEEDVSKVAILKTDESGEDGRSGRVLKYKEKPTLAEAEGSRLGSIGFYVLSPEVYGDFEKQGFAHFKKNEIFDYALNFFPSVLAAGKKMWAQQVPGYWNDIGRPDQYIAVLKDLYAGRLNINLPQNVREFFENGVIFWPGTRAKVAADQAQLSGNIIVAQNNTRNSAEA